MRNFQRGRLDHLKKIKNHVDMRLGKQHEIREENKVIFLKY